MSVVGDSDIRSSMNSVLGDVPAQVEYKQSEFVLVHLLHLGFFSSHCMFRQKVIRRVRKRQAYRYGRTLIRLLLQARQPPRDFR